MPEENTIKKPLVSGKFIQLAGAALAVFAFSAFVIAPIIVSKIFVLSVSGTSMQPTLQPSSSYAMVKTDELERGNIVVGEAPEEWMEKIGPAANAIVVKRIAALPGDKIELKKDHLYVNGNEAADLGISTSCKPDSLKLTVPGGKMFVVGDNRQTSFDSMAAWCAGSEDMPFYIDKKTVLATGELAFGSHFFGEMIK